MKSYGKNFLDRVYRDSGILRNQKITFKNAHNRCSIHNNQVCYVFEYSDSSRIQLPYVPIQPQTLLITVDGLLGDLRDLSTDNTEEIHLMCVNGYVGAATVNLKTGILELALNRKSNDINYVVRVNYAVDDE